VAVLTGGPAVGKSFTVRSVVELARAKGATIVLAAPTGRAATRLAELTGHEAATIRRLLQLRPGGEPSFGAANPLTRTWWWWTSWPAGSRLGLAWTRAATCRCCARCTLTSARVLTSAGREQAAHARPSSTVG
jgi:AAA domain